MMKTSIPIVWRRATSSIVARRSLASVASRSDGGSWYGKQDVVDYLNKKNANGKNDSIYALSFGDDAMAFSSMVEPSALMKEQLRYSQDQLKSYKQSPVSNNKISSSSSSEDNKLDNAALPRTLEDVVRQKSRAIVVTECNKPFKVVDVNECWEGLCGFSFREAHGKSLGELLKGPETDQVAATGLVAHLLAGEEAGAVLTNYRKDGRAFRNRIRVGPIYDPSGKNITHFVGVLQEIKDGAEQQKQMM